MATEITMHSFAAQKRDKLIERMEELAADGAPNRASLLMLARLATTPDRAALMLEAMEQQDFLDSRDPAPEDRYAWDLLLHAAETWAVLARQPNTVGQNANRERGAHLIACALDSQFRYWLAQSKEASQGIDSDEVHGLQVELIAAVEAQLQEDPAVLTDSKVGAAALALAQAANPALAQQEVGV